MNTLTASPETKKILQEKIETRLHEGQERNKKFIDVIENEGSLLNDFIAPLGKNTGVSFDANGKVSMFVNEQKFNLHPHAVIQTAQKFGMPTGYVKDLINGSEDWQRKLIAHSLNEFSTHSNRQRVLVRAVGDEVRGVLSDSYRRLNTAEIYGGFLEASKKNGAEILDAFADDTRSYIEVVNPNIVEIPTAKNGTVYSVFGARISSSDFGDGALEMRAFWLQVVCLNGAVAQSLVRQVHLGRQIPDNIKMSEHTYKLDTRTQASLVNDIIRQTLSKEHIGKQAMLIQDASAVLVDMDTEIKLLPKVGLSKDEAEQTKKIVMNNKVEDGVQGGSTLWKLSQAVSAVGRQYETRRKKEIDEIAGMLMSRVSKN
jgi:hypothetical protein